MHRPLPWPGCSATSPGRALPNREHPALPGPSQVQVRRRPRTTINLELGSIRTGAVPWPERNAARSITHFSKVQLSEVHQCGHPDTASATLQDGKRPRTVPCAAAIVGCRRPVLGASRCHWPRFMPARRTKGALKAAQRSNVLQQGPAGGDVVQGRQLGA